MRVTKRCPQEANPHKMQPSFRISVTDLGANEILGQATLAKASSRDKSHRDDGCLFQCHALRERLKVLNARPRVIVRKPYQKSCVLGNNLCFPSMIANLRINRLLKLSRHDAWSGTAVPTIIAHTMDLSSQQPAIATCFAIPKCVPLAGQLLNRASLLSTLDVRWWAR
ncbi:uncharacterized protein MEPE_04268 [Melanopsichium pennsylvanicum]|uniref:Uncharacterized protein n=1 Tax=Melanopsichium pennsylvanicum TaxID=63383 RepID=A0AAJ5C6J6_9BASI|nr:uncharacterized protein MEPE_04268 [Melanopsichium pennsylvanicum]